MAISTSSIAARRADWHAALKRVQSEPLTYCPRFPEIAARWNAWWRFEADRPIVSIDVHTDPDIRWDKCFDLLEQPDQWVQLRRRQIERTHFAGEALPYVRVDIGPVSMAAYLGAPLHISEAQQTTWHDPIIDSWDDFAGLQLDEHNTWLQRVLTLMEHVAEDARGHYLVGTPDLTGAIDCLANLRTSQLLCMDLFEHRETVKAAAMQAVDAWERVFVKMYDLLATKGVGNTRWVTVWADQPFTLPTCDFNVLLGPDDHDEICLPSLSEQARRAGLCCFHLDGPDASRHAPALAADPHITAIQYVPGTATPSALAKLDMYRMFQEHRKPLYIECPVSEVKQLAESLDPRGTAIRAHGVRTVEQADELIEWRDARFG